MKNSRIEGKKCVFGVLAVFLTSAFVPASSGGFLFYFGAQSASAQEMPAVATPADKTLDSDHDGLADWDEAQVYHTDPLNSDTDGDGYPDGQEVKNGYSPRHGGGQKLARVDSDSDYLSDAMEIALGTDLTDPDSDGDKYLDGTEVAASYNPLNAAPVQLEKLIKVSLASQRLTYYFGGQPVDSFLISSGVKRLPSPQGEFTILDKVPVKHYKGPGFDLPNTKWNLHFTTTAYRYYIHGAYWHDNFGHPMSHGCINVSYENMEPLYWWAQVGTKVEIY